MTKLSAVFCKIDLPHMSVGERRKKSGPKIHFWVAGEAFFSDLGHFSEFEDFSKFEDFGCLKHITLANHHTAVMKERLTLCSSQKHVYGINLLIVNCKMPNCSKE